MFAVALLRSFLKIPENFQEIVFREAETCSITKNRFHRNVFLQSWTKGCREIHKIKEDRIFYGMFYSDFLPKNVKMWLLVGWLRIRWEIQTF